jgi:hypothetical protein
MLNLALNNIPVYAFVHACALLPSRFGDIRSMMHEEGS